MLLLYQIHVNVLCVYSLKNGFQLLTSSMQFSYYLPCASKKRHFIALDRM